MRSTFILFALLALLPWRAAAAVPEIGAGAGFMGFGGLGYMAFVQPRASRWRFGFEASRVPDDVFRDPFTGRPLTRTRDDFAGVFLHRQFTPGQAGRWYAALSYLRWRRTETSLMAGDSSKDSSTDLYLGIGCLVPVLGHGFINFGFGVAPGASMHTKTSTSSDDSGGAADLQFNVGLKF